MQSFQILTYCNPLIRTPTCAYERLQYVNARKFCVTLCETAFEQYFEQKTFEIVLENIRNDLLYILSLIKINNTKQNDLQR